MTDELLKKSGLRIYSAVRFLTNSPWKGRSGAVGEGRSTPGFLLQVGL